MAETVFWEGASGKSYNYWIYSLNIEFPEEPANYIFVKETSESYVPIRIGHTDNIKRRFASYEKEIVKCMKQHGITHVHAHVNSLEADRLQEEQDLLKKWNPPCNRQQ